MCGRWLSPFLAQGVPCNGGYFRFGRLSAVGLKACRFVCFGGCGAPNRSLCVKCVLRCERGTSACYEQGADALRLLAPWCAQQESSYG